MSSQTPTPTGAGLRATRLFVILNPSAGRWQGGELQAALDRRFDRETGPFEIHRARPREDLSAIAREAADRGCEIVVAAGGDGTVSAVAGGLVQTEAALGILPLGTTNVLARELGIPIELEEAIALLAGPHEMTRLDAMRIGDRHFFTQVGVGLDALMIRDTSREQKKRFGRLAYLGVGLARWLGFHPRRFTIQVDGQARRSRASQVLVANSGTLGQPPFRWGPSIRPDDGCLNVCVFRPVSLFDHGRLFWNVLRGRHRDEPNIQYHEATRSVQISSLEPLPVQADGEIIGQTPIELSLIPGALRVLVPKGVGGKAGPLDRADPRGAEAR